MLYIILFLTTGIVGAILYLYDTWLVTWYLFDGFNITDSFISALQPYICLIAFAACSWGAGVEVTSYTSRWTSFNLMGIVCCASVLVAYYLSVKRYRTAGYRPNYAAFCLILCYLAILMAISYMLVF